jgi:hypothetical protein
MLSNEEWQKKDQSFMKENGTLGRIIHGLVVGAEVLSDCYGSPRSDQVD